MKFFISVDMEGIGGVNSWKEMTDPETQYQARTRMTEEVNAVIKGIKNSGRKIEEITVCDSHALGNNLLLDNIDKSVSIVRGFPRKFYMMESLDSSYDAVFFVGYHSRIGTAESQMDHSYSSFSIYNLWVNGKLRGETEINAALAGYYNVPLVFVSGDDKLEHEVKTTLGENIITVVTKIGLSRFAAKNKPLNKIRNELTNKVALAIKNLKNIKPFKIEPPLDVKIELINTVMADIVMLLPQFKRVDGRTIKFKSNDYLEFYRLLMVITYLAFYTKNL